MKFCDLPQGSMDSHLAFSLPLGFPVSYPEAILKLWDIIHEFLWLSQGSVSCTFASILELWSSAWYLLAVFRVWRFEYCLSVTRVPLRSINVLWGFSAWWLLNQGFPDLVGFFSCSQFLQYASYFLSIITYAATMHNSASWEWRGQSLFLLLVKTTLTGWL